MFTRRPPILLPLALIAWLSFGAASYGTTLQVTPSLDVALTSGTFRGVANPNGTDAWLGIPFAQPPIGPLRFKAPLSIVQPLQTIQDASQFGDACPQPPSSILGANMSENCLFLNVCCVAFDSERLAKELCKCFVGMAANRNFRSRATSCVGLVLCMSILTVTSLAFPYASGVGRSVYHQVPSTNLP